MCLRIVVGCCVLCFLFILPKSRAKVEDGSYFNYTIVEGLL